MEVKPNTPEFGCNRGNAGDIAGLQSGKRVPYCRGELPFAQLNRPAGELCG